MDRGLVESGEIGARPGASLQGRMEEVLDLMRNDPAANAAYLRQLVTRTVVGAVQSLAGSAYEVRGSTGIGVIADVPWVGVFPEDERASAQEGYYPVYLFGSKGSAVYLSLLCGTDAFPVRVARKRALDLRTALGSQPDLSQDIELGSSSARPRKYEAATAFAIRYDAGSVPTDDVLEKDLARMLSLRSEADDAGLEFNPVEPQHLVLKWSPDREPRTVELARAVAEEHGSVWWGCPGGTGSGGLSDSQFRALLEQLEKHPGATHAYVYRRDECWRSVVIGATDDRHNLDETLLPANTDPSEYGLFVQLKDFQSVDSDWPISGLVPINNPSTDAVAEALGNQRTPLLVYERFVPDARTIAELPASREVELTMDWLEQETLLTAETLRSIIESLKGHSPQVILAGPPGTSKTWVAERITRYITGDNPLCSQTVQFHPSYGYEEFIEGLRPVASAGGIAFERVDGIVLDMVAKIQDEEQLHVMVIDEMNRANLPRVLGELMYLFEYRNKPLNLAYTKNFELPRNLLFVGTMNTADRSIRGIDIALRRRFEVFELNPDAAILQRFYSGPKYTNEISNLIAGFERLNAALSASLDRHHTIGHSFFMADHMTPARLRAVWDRKIAPLIEEYFFDQPQETGEFQFSRFWPDIDDANSPNN